MNTNIFTIAITLAVSAVIGIVETSTSTEATNEVVTTYTWDADPLYYEPTETTTTEPEQIAPTTTEPPVTTTEPPVTTTEPVEVTEEGGEPVYEWLGRIPEEYGEGSGCTREEASRVAVAMREVGASDDSIEWMLYVISRESLCDPSAHNGNRNTGDDSFGLCQQNNLSGWFDEGQLLENFDRFAFASDFDLNARSCAVMWARCGKGPWRRGDYGCSVPSELR